MSSKSSRTTARPRQPKGVTAILAGGGLRVPCNVIPDGTDDQGLPKFRIVAEIDWRQYQIERIEIQWWPAGCALALDLGNDITDMELLAYAARIEWLDLSDTDN